MSRNPLYKPASSSSRKGYHSYEASPLHSSKLRKENNMYVPPAGNLENHLRASSKSGVRKNDPKLVGTNVFINNLNVHISNMHNHQRRVAPPSASVTNRKNSKPYTMPSNEEVSLTEYRDAKRKQSRERVAHTSFEETLQTNHNTNSNSNYEVVKKTHISLGPKQIEALNELQRSNYIPKFKSTDPTNKFTMRSPPKILAAIEPNKFKKPNSRSQQKSFDVNAGPGPITKYTPYLNTIGKVNTTATNNSPRNNSDSRINKSDNSSRISQGVGPRATKAPLEKSVVAPKIFPQKAPVLAPPRHKKTPSFDIGKRNDSFGHVHNTSNPSILERNRRSADHGDYRQGAQTEPFAKSTFRFAIRTRAGVAPNGTRKINQDSFIFHTNFGKKSDRYLLGVCDGHGMNGHFVSGFVKDSLPVYLLSDPTFAGNPGDALINSFELCQQKLLVSDFDCKFSGTTSIVLLVDGNRIISANAGDSRAIMGNYDKGVWDFTALSEDHKPDSPDEAQRIMKCGGRIEPFKDYDGNHVGPARVWLMHQEIPGLAMARSLGDFVAASVGVSCTPEIQEFTINPTDKFLIVASDGVWEFIESIDVVRIIAPFYEQNNIEGACDYILGLALQRWQEEEEVVVDDITFILIFF